MRATGPESVVRYALPLRLLHWTIALLAALALATGATLAVLGFEGAMAVLGRTGTNILYTSHKSLGVAILVLMLTRVVVRMTTARPLAQRNVANWQRIASGSVHATLYLGLLAVPVLGWLATGSGGFPVQFLHLHLPPLLDRDPALSELLFRWHGWIALALAGLICLHLGAAWMHSNYWKDETFDRIRIGRKRNRSKGRA